MAGPLQLSTKHKAYAATLAAALGALVYDRCHSSGPASARGAVPIAVAAPAERVAGPAELGPAEPPTGEAGGMAARLRALPASAGDPLAGLRDAFAPPPAWAAERGAGTPDAAAAVGVAEFAAGHRLSVVMLSGRDGGGSAVIGGRLVRVGQAVDGYRLTAVRPRSARLSGPGGALVELQMR